MFFLKYKLELYKKREPQLKEKGGGGGEESGDNEQSTRR